jgi:ethanolamine utilization protein EutN
MFLGRVKGTVVSTIQHPKLDGQRLLLVERVDTAGRPTGASVIALDSVQAGLGQTVLVVDEGNSSRQILGDKEAPVRTMIVGIVDQVSVG